MLAPWLRATRVRLKLPKVGSLQGNGVFSVCLNKPGNPGSEIQKRPHLALNKRADEMASVPA